MCIRDRFQGVLPLYGEKQGQPYRGDEGHKQRYSAQSGDWRPVHMFGCAGHVDEAEAPGQATDKGGKEQGAEKRNGEGEKEDDHRRLMHELWPGAGGERSITT